MKLSGLPKNYDDLPRDEKITAEESRLSKYLKGVQRENSELCKRLIERAAFMAVTLAEYEDIIAREGVTSQMQQGDYEITREHPAVKGYNTMVKNYQSIVRQLIDLLPDKKDANADKAGERLAKFVAAGK